MAVRSFFYVSWKSRESCTKRKKKEMVKVDRLKIQRRLCLPSSLLITYAVSFISFWLALYISNVLGRPCSAASPGRAWPVVYRLLLYAAAWPSSDSRWPPIISGLPKKGASHQIWAIWHLLQFWWLAPIFGSDPQ